MVTREISMSFMPAVALAAAMAVIGTACTAAPVKSAVTAAATSAATSAAGATAPLSADAWQARYNDRYKRNWGVDIVGVKPVSSGYMLRFSYRVLDVDKAAPLLEQKTRPYLFDEVSGARLAVPAMENIGELRQTGKPAADRTYYIIFGNPGRLVKSGGRVRIVIGNFEVDDLIVD